MTNKNKTRGNYYEEKIVKIYRSKYGLTQFECYRSGSSGARQSLEINGDISFSDPGSYPIITECKYRKTLKLEDLFPTLSSECMSWIEQTEEEISRYKLHFNNEPFAMLVMGRPYIRDDYVIPITLPTNPGVRWKFPQSYIRTKDPKSEKWFILTTLTNILPILDSFIQKK